MGSRPEYAETTLIADMAARAARPRLVYVSLVWEIYERGEAGPERVETIHDLHVVFDRLTGQRLIVRDEDLDGDLAFVEHARAAEQVPLVYSVTAKQYAAIVDEDHRVIAAFGGEGGGKTHCLGLWMVRTWLRVGCRGADLWWVAPSKDQTQIGVRKLAAGESGRPPLIPSSLVASYPTSTQCEPQAIILADGSRIPMYYASVRARDGGNLKGTRPRAIGVDEACEIKSIRIWRIIRGRVVRARHGDDFTRAQIFLSSTPEEGHWAETEIVLPVDSGAETEATYTHLTQFDNPWIPPEDTEAAIKAKGGRDDPQVRREIFGEWASAADRAYYKFKVRRSCRVFEGLDELGLDDVTQIVVRERWQRLGPEVVDTIAAGQDFNLAPCVTVLVKFGVPRGRAYVGEGDLVAVVCDEYVTELEGYEGHGAGLRARFGMIPISCDATGAQTGATKDVKGSEAKTHARRLARAGHAVMPAGYSRRGQPANPSVSDSIEQVNALAGTDAHGVPRLLVHTRCRRVLDALQGMKRGRGGGHAKRAGDAADRLSAAADALRYALIRAMPATLSAIEDR